MTSNYTNFVYLVSNIINCFIINYFFKLFFDKKKELRKVLFISPYILYYITISSCYIIYNNSYINLLINLIFFFIITQLYISSLKKKVISIFLLYSILLVIESLSVLLVSFLSAKYQMEISMLVSKWISLLLVQNFRHLKNINKDYYFSKYIWLFIMIFPLSTIIFFILLKNEIHTTSLIICLMILLLFNFIIIYIYDVLNNEYHLLLKNTIRYEEKNYENKLNIMEKNYYFNQLKILSESYKKFEALKHDYKNHFLSLVEFIKNGKNEEALEYLSKLLPDQLSKEIYVSSGNLIIDSIMNYKITAAISDNIVVRYTMKIPEDLEIDIYDINVILGNIMDNAIEACRKCQSIKKINILISYDKGVLFIRIKNTFNGDLLYENNSLSTTKNDKLLHGIGLKNVDNIIRKYNGYRKYYTECNYFITKIIIYI